MARRFAYISFGIFCLTVAYQLGAERARADWVSNQSGIFMGGDDGFLWTANGQCWELTSDGTWLRLEERDLPVAALDVKHLTAYGSTEQRLITQTDEAWVFRNGAWSLADPFPGGPIAVEQESAGSVKGKYRR